MYFFSYSNGIWYLDNNGEIKQTNITKGSFGGGAIGQNNILYIGSIEDNGIWYLDNDGEIKQTNIIKGSFGGGAIGQNNKLYFYTQMGNITPIHYLDNDNIIKPTNITDCITYCATIGQNGKLYFGAHYYLDNDGEIKPTNYKGVTIKGAAIATNNKLYFAPYFRNVLLYLDDDGLIKETKTNLVNYWGAAKGQNGKLYVNNPDLYRLTFGNTGKLITYTGIYTNQYGNQKKYNLLDHMYGTFPKITVEQLRQMSEKEINNRIFALFNVVIKDKTMKILNNAITDNTTTCKITN